MQAGQGVHIVELELGFFLEQIHQFIPFPRQSHEPSVVSVALPSNPNTNATACHWASALPVHEVPDHFPIAITLHSFASPSSVHTSQVPQSDPTATQRTLTTSGLPRDRPLEVAFWDTSLGGTEQQRVWSQVASLLDNHNTFLRVRALAVSPDHATSTATLQAQQWAAHVPTTSFQSELGDSELRVSTADRPRLAAFLNAVDVVVVGGWRGSLWACAFAKSLGATACIVDGPVSPAPLPTHVVDAHLVSSLSDANALRQRGAAVLEVPAAFSPGASPRRAKKDEMKPQVRIALWSGRFDAADAPALFVEACSSLRASQPQLRCWLHGCDRVVLNSQTYPSLSLATFLTFFFVWLTRHGPQEAMLRSLADESNIDDATVTFLSDEEPLVPMLQGSRAFVFTAIPGALNQEASAALEKAGRDAAASGLPFVGFGALESFCPEWNGVAASAPTSSALADAMNLALFGTDVTTYSERSLQLARARFMPFTAAMARATALVDVYRALNHVREGSPRAKGVDLTDGLKTMLARSEGQETVRVGFDSEIEGTMVRCEEICRGWPTPPLRQRLHSPWGRLVASPLEVAVVHIRPTEVPDAAFEVGFLQAMRLLESLGKLKFTMLNLMDLNYLDGDTVRNEACSYFEAFDVVFIKSNFQYHVDEFARDFLHACAVPRVLLVSGSYPPAAPEHARFYDLCFFEVFWFENRHLTNHPAAVHAFGIDRRMLLQGAANASNASAPGKAWDLLFIGAMADHAGHKRPHLIGHKSGRRVAVGKADSEEAQAVVADLRRQGVTVLAPLPYSQLAALIQVSLRLCLLIYRARVFLLPSMFLCCRAQRRFTSRTTIWAAASAQSWKREHSA